MATFDDYGTFIVHIDRRWSLEDLYIFPRAFEQVYFALEAILPSPGEEVENRIDRAFRAFPWRGGYSAVNFYNRLKYATPAAKRPRVESIQYASPGWLELYLALGLAVTLGHTVRSVAKTLDRCNATYNGIMRDMLQRKLLRIEVERARIGLSRDEFQLVEEYSDMMAKVLQIRSADAIHERTRNPLVSLKILLSIYRRVRTLAEYQIRGKADFSNPTGRIDIDGEPMQ